MTSFSKNFSFNLRRGHQKISYGPMPRVCRRKDPILCPEKRRKEFGKIKVNHLVSSAHKSARIVRISILQLEGINKYHMHDRSK